MTQQGDLAYTTIYDGSKDSVSEWQHEAYGFRFWCNATYIFNIEVFSAYKSTINVAFTLFDITPIKLMLKYQKPEFGVA